MIRKVKLSDAAEIAAIYNGYVLRGVETFETEAVPEAEMRARISEISARFPYFVAEIDGVVAGYCYAHLWKQRAAYARTWETTVYLAPEFFGRGLASALYAELFDACRAGGYAVLIACITSGNEASVKFHEKSGFEKVSHFKKVGEKFGRVLDVEDWEKIL